MAVAAVEAVGAIGGDDAVRILEPLTVDPGELGHAAVRVLGRVRTADALDVLRKALRSDDAQRRRVAVEALTTSEHGETVELLQWTAAADPDGEVARAALDGLGAKANHDRVNGRLAVQALVGCVSERERRSAALGTLARLTPPAIPWLAEALTADDPQIRRGVVEALGRLSHPAASAYLQRAMSDGDAIVRRQAVGALSRIGTLGLARRLSTLAQSDPSPAVRQAAAAALHRRGAAEGENA